MVSTEMVTGICVAVSVCFLFTASVLAVWFLRFRDRRKMRTATTLTRGLSTYRRARLSVDGANYSHIQRPRAPLRRSGHLPHGVFSEARTEVSSQESLRPEQMASIEERPETDGKIPAPKRKKSLRQTLYTHSMNVPKTRRQKKIERTVTQSVMPLSPLSAITEFTSPSEVPTPNIIELPTDFTPRQTPEKPSNVRTWDRPVSVQWPLPLAVRRSKDISATVVTSIPARESIFVRKGSLKTTSHLEKHCMGRSLSMTSDVSNAPKEPLPPLPPQTRHQYCEVDQTNTRNSYASLDTIGSSVLGSIQGSPAQKISYNSASPTIDLSSPGLNQFSPTRDRGNPSAITVGTAAGKRAQHGTVKVKPGTHSFRASIGEHAALRKASSTQTTESSDQRFNNARLFANSLETIDASNWDPDLSSMSISRRSTLSPSLPAPVARRPYTRSARHSVFDSQLSIAKRASNPVEHNSAAEILTRSPLQLVLPRPASVASGNPYQWDLRPPSFSTLPAKRGHQRQNCVRIANLPVIDPNRNSKLPEMMEEEDEEVDARPRIPGLTLLEAENGIPALRARSSLVDVRASPSPFHNQPFLEPTSRKWPSSRRKSSTESHGIPRPDSDIFTHSMRDPVTPTPFEGQHRGFHHNWPLSPTPRNDIKLNSTTPTHSAIEEPYEPDSPMLPSPALTSATLFPRKSEVQGPRNRPASTKSSRNASPSPLNGRAGQTQKRTGDELRRSVMMLRRLTSEGNFLDPASRLYRNMGDQSVSNFSLPHVQSGLGLGIKGANNISGNLMVSDRWPVSNMALNMSASGSKTGMAMSPSMMSMSGVSIWEDASVYDEADLKVRNSMMQKSDQMPLAGHDPEAYENFFGQSRIPIDTRDGERDRRLTSPQEKVLGITVRDWGTPASLYDLDGFLK